MYRESHIEILNKCSEDIREFKEWLIQVYPSNYSYKITIKINDEEQWPENDMTYYGYMIRYYSEYYFCVIREGNITLPSLYSVKKLEFNQEESYYLNKRAYTITSCIT